MKALAVSDKVVDFLYASDVRRRYPDIDLIIGCGDLPWYYLDFLLSSLDTPLIYVRGNHDGDPQFLSNGEMISSLAAGIDLHERVKMVNGLLCAGMEGSIRYHPNAPLMYTEKVMRRKILALTLKVKVAEILRKRRLDLFVVHSPPFGIHDEDDRAHIGFKAYLDFMRWAKPRYLLHGHVHHYGSKTIRETKYLQTTVCNVFPYQIFDIVT